jgi:hypothetical protein
VETGDSVRYRRRLFVVVAVSTDGQKLTLRDDEGEYLTVRASQVSPA